MSVSVGIAVPDERGFQFAATSPQPRRSHAAATPRPIGLREQPPMPQPKHILLLVETSKAYGRALLRGIGLYAMAHGRWSLYVDERGLDDRQPSWLKGWKGDGIIFRSFFSAMVDAIRAIGVPAVDTNSGVAGHGFPLVYPDEEGTAQLAIDHFRGRRFEHFAFCAIEEAPWVQWRRQFYVSCLQRHRLPCHTVSVGAAQGRSSWDRQRSQLAQWVRGLPKPVAVLAANDVCGMRLIDACRCAEVSVPEQVAVLGVDNDTVLDMLTSPAMSSIDLNVQQIGYKAAALLDRLMRGEPKPEVPVLIQPAGVVTRQSTDVFAVDDPGVADALSFIRRHAQDGITVADVADHLSISRATLERRFADEMNRTPKNEITRVRLEQVKQLLTLTEHTLPQVAELTGFKTASHLSVVFKRETGLSPTQFRKQSGS